MARQPRFVLAGHPQRVIIRGNNREPIFCANEDFRFSLEKLKQACDKHDCDLHACVLMTNHVHLLITPNQDDSLSKAIQMLGRYYVLNGSDDLTDCTQPVTPFASLPAIAPSWVYTIPKNPEFTTPVGHPPRYSTKKRRFCKPSTLPRLGHRAGAEGHQREPCGHGRAGVLTPLTGE